MSEGTSPIDRFAFGPVAAVRPWLFAKALYLVLAFDVWHTLVGPAWRYGAAGFNVAHFAILDALPIPTREAYVGMLVLVGAMAIVAATLPRTPRALSIAITLLYTWGWSCSMLDSYQHHYLLSGMLVTVCLYPQLTAIELFGTVTRSATAPAPTTPSKGQKKRARVASASKWVAMFPHGLVARVRSIGWTLTTTFAGIVYAFTAVSKAEPEWRSGDALRNITHEGATMPEAMDFAESIGFAPETVFHLMGTGMIAVQIVCALGYLTASLRDGLSTSGERQALGDALRVDSTRITIAFAVSLLLALGAWLRFNFAYAVVVFVLGVAVGMPRSFQVLAFAPKGRPEPLSMLASLALLVALSFHAGAEYIGLQIGWFSYYMMVLALAALTPAPWLAAFAESLSAPFRTLEPSMLARAPIAAPIAGLVAAGIAAYAGAQIDLPGSQTACLVVAAVAAASGIAGLALADHRGSLARVTVALGVAMIACWLSMTSGTERYDFYRFGGGDFRRRHEYRRALEDYRRANLYAPPGQSRDDRVREVEAAIRAEGGTP